MDGRVIGPYMISLKLAVAMHSIIFLQNLLNMLLDAVRTSGFSTTVHPPPFLFFTPTSHFPLDVWEQLDRRFGQGWESRGGSIAWPP